jgi:hypothetical protein
MRYSMAEAIAHISRSEQLYRRHRTPHPAVRTLVKIDKVCGSVNFVAATNVNWPLVSDADEVCHVKRESPQQITPVRQ